MYMMYKLRLNTLVAHL